MSNSIVEFSITHLKKTEDNSLKSDRSNRSLDTIEDIQEESNVFDKMTFYSFDNGNAQNQNNE